MTTANNPIILKGKQKQFLRGLGHHLDAVVYVGREGLSDNLINSVMDGLKTRELIKIKLGQNCEIPKKEAAARLAELTGAALVQLIGKTVLLYLPNKDLKPEKRISLPR
jgi:RNA-binding protein